MDLGFPAHWAAKDTVTVIALCASVALTARALRLQTLADQATVNGMLPEIERVGEAAYERSPRVAMERAVKRAAVERAALQRRTSSMYWVLAVIAASVASLPWLVLFGLVVAIGWIIYSVVRFRRGMTSIDRRLNILEQIREYSSRNHQGGHVFDQQLYAQIDLVFTKPDSDLDAFERLIQQALVKQATENRAYAARQQARFAAAEISEPPTDGGEASPPPGTT